jgi:hypothetical protein
VIVAIAILAIVLAVAFVATRWVRVSASLQAMVDEDAWAIAWGAKIGPFALTGARARGASIAKAKASGASDRLIRVARWLAGVIDPIVVLELALDALAHVRVESFELRLRGGDPDPLLMGRVAAILAVASGTLAPVATIDAALDWTAEYPSLDVRASGAVAFTPFGLALDGARFALRLASLRIRTALARRNSTLAIERA